MSNPAVYAAFRGETLAQFLAEHGVAIVASLPCYLEDNVDRQRGNGVFARSIAALQQLNALGYGQPDSGLELNLVFNPQGPSLPPPQEAAAPVRGLMMIGIEGRGAEKTMARLTGIPAVLAVHSTNGRWDLIAELGTQTLVELDEVIYRIRNIEGVMTSETNLLLSTRKAGRR